MITKIMETLKIVESRAAKNCTLIFAMLCTAQNTTATEIKKYQPKIVASTSTLGESQTEFEYMDFSAPIGFFNSNNTDSVELQNFSERPRRVDRGINRKKFIFAGEKILGISFSHMSINSSNSDFMLMLNNISANGAVSSVKPFVGYLYRDNRAVGGRFVYTNINAELKAAAIDLGASNGISMNSPYLNVESKSYEYALFHRAYAALGDSGKFGLFAEVELAATFGTSIFGLKDEEENYTSIESRNRSFNLGFNPGITAFVFHNVSASVSFGLGGFKYSHIEQFNEEGIYIGDRVASNMRFSLNLMAINFGITMHLWSQKEPKFKM